MQQHLFKHYLKFGGQATPYSMNTSGAPLLVLLGVPM